MAQNHSESTVGWLLSKHLSLCIRVSFLGSVVLTASTQPPRGPAGSHGNHSSARSCYLQPFMRTVAQLPFVCTAPGQSISSGWGDGWGRASGHNQDGGTVQVASALFFFFKKKKKLYSEKKMLIVVTMSCSHTLGPLP